MTAYPISVEPDVSFQKAVSFMAERGFGNLVVSDGTIPKGILTEREIVKAIAESKNLEKIKVKDMGWQPYVQLSLGNTVLDAAHLMSQKKSRLLVFEKDKLVGIVTVSDLLRAFRKTENNSSLDSMMSAKIEKCKYTDSVLDTIQKMHDKRIGSIIVDDVSGRGIFTERDLLIYQAANRLDLSDQVGKYSSTPLVVANIGIKAHEAASIMAANNIKRLGLTQDDTENSLQGIVTARDLVNAYQSVCQVKNPYPEK